ncbi:hypothetical protein DRP04_05550 [Archaeoglobales archaeon]|nr:MAG: hypothetical protein DRP04_05550 [Archaeoglobales archaeon]
MEEVPLVKKFLPSDIPMVRIYRMCDYGVPQVRKRLFAGKFVEPVKHPVDVVFPAVLATEYKGTAGPRQMKRLSWAFGRKSLIPECKLIQTFPLDYIVYGTLQEQYIQIGNAVPPLMSFRLAEAILMAEEGLVTLDPYVELGPIH